MEFELADYDVTVQYVNHHATVTHPLVLLPMFDFLIFFLYLTHTHTHLLSLSFSLSLSLSLSKYMYCIYIYIYIYRERERGGDQFIFRVKNRRKCTREFILYYKEYMCVYWSIYMRVRIYMTWIRDTSGQSGAFYLPYVWSGFRVKTESLKRQTRQLISGSWRDNDYGDLTSSIG